ncbi:hypothetical protein [Methylocystis sp.]|uniref:hypothetical protein n=1 Tax=Methylocystis sp. TaxID=1911079 RepID=UPI0025E7144A|nr:hypothetical protein [Methylocystis sp.]
MSELTSTPERQALAQAIEALTLAQNNLDESVRAAKKARDKNFEAERLVDTLAEEIEHSDDTAIDAFITSLASADIDATTLERPLVELKAKLEAAKHEAEVWQRARTAAEQSIRPRREAVDWAARHVDNCARRVMGREVNAAALLCNAEAAQNEVLSKRAELMAIARALDDHDESRKSIERFIANPWLLIDWEQHPSARRIAEHFAKLKAGGDTSLKAH